MDVNEMSTSQLLKCICECGSGNLLSALYYIFLTKGEERFNHNVFGVTVGVCTYRFSFKTRSEALV